MMRAFLGVALLAAGGLLGQDYYLPANPLAWGIVVVLGVLLLSRGTGRGFPRREALIALVLSIPAVWFAPWPLRAAPLLIVVGLALQLLPIPRRWPRPLAHGALTAGVVMLAQSLAMALYTGYTARCHELPWPFPNGLAGIARLLGIEAEVDGSTVVMHSIRQTHRLGATWELLLDPATVCFYVGGLILFAVIVHSELPELQRRTAGIRLFKAFTWVVVAWLPIRAGLLMALYVHRVVRFDGELPLHVMNQFLSPWVHLLMLAGGVLLAWRFVRLPSERQEESGERKAESGEGAVSCTGSAFGYPLSAFSVPLSVFLAVALFTTAIHWDPVGTRQAGRVMVVERHSVWEPTTKPYDTKWFGHDSGYNYAAVYDYCGQYFEMSRLLESDAIDDEKLSQCDVLVIKTPTARYAPEEVDTVVRFVERGGGLLLIGDHTNFEKSSTYMNDVTRKMGFTFRNDLLFSTGSSPYEQHYRKPRVPHPIVQHLPPTDLAVSCSIDPGRSRGRAAMLSTGLWSLPPDYHIGNYHTVPQHRPDMRYGAFIQLWSTRYGKGRVLAFTDSTIFSNFCVFQGGKAELFAGMIEWLNHRNLGDPRRWLLAIGLLPLLIGLWTPRTRKPDWLVLLAAGLLGWTLASLAVAAVAQHAMPVPKVIHPMTKVVIDRTVSDVQLSKGAYIEVDRDSYGLFEQWISRLATPHGKCYTTRRSGPEAFSGDALVIIEPSRSVSREFRRQLIDYVANGGKLLVVDSPENAASTANSLLWPFGLSILHDRAADDSDTLLLSEDWPDIEIEQALAVEGGQSLARLGTTSVGAMVKYEQGTVMALGFGSALNDANLGFPGMRAMWIPQPTANMLFTYDTYVRYNVQFALLRALLTAHPLAEEYTGRVVFDRTISEVPLRDPDATEHADEGFAFFEMWPAYLGCSTSLGAGDEAFFADVLVVLYPTREVSDEFRERLLQYVDEGGKLLVVDSPDNKNSTADALLKPFELSIDHEATQGGQLLVERGEDEGGPWPDVTIEPACEVHGGEPFAAVDEMPVGATIRHGRGQVTAVGFGSMFTTAAMRASWDLPPPAKSLVPYDLQTAILRALIIDQPFAKSMPSVSD